MQALPRVATAYVYTLSTWMRLVVASVILSKVHLGMNSCNGVQLQSSSPESPPPPPR